MKVSYKWLKDYVDISLSPDELADKMTLFGLEVEEVENYGSSLDGVIVGEVLSVKPHPNADRLQICDVNIGNETKQIICGAKNVAAGQKVPVATVGTTLPVQLDDGSKLTIKKAKLRGEKSEGMICAEDELGLGTDHSGIMVLKPELKIGTPISEVFDLYEDSIIDIAITPNRPDATCHYGVARDIAASEKLSLKEPFKFEAPDTVESTDDFTIEIKNPDKCHRYTGIVMRGVKVEESPSWLKNRLKAIGLRPVNNIVDITNFVMYELGQPLHAFDLSLLKDNTIVVQDFEKEITFETLDHTKRTCSAGTLFICDAEEPVAIAGVMGGVDSEVNDDTSEILIESAWFDPVSIRKTAKEQNLQTDASYRFERGVDPNLQLKAAVRAAELIAEIAGGEISGNIIDVHPVKTKPKEIKLRISYVNRLLGTRFSADEVQDILKGLGLSLIEQNENELHYQIPTFRPDLEREVDLIEEVGRLYDYNNIPEPGHGIFVSSEAINDWEKLLEKSRNAALSLGFREIYTNSLISEKEASKIGKIENMIQTLNPLTADMSTLRPSLIHGFLKSVSYNFNRNVHSVRFFEQGHVFEKSDDASWFEGIMEEAHILLGIAGLKHSEHWTTPATPYTFADLKAEIHGLLEKLNIASHVEEEATDNHTLTYLYKGTPIGMMLRLDEKTRKNYEIEHPVFLAELSLSVIHALTKESGHYGFSPIPKYPPFDFDFAVIVDQQVAAGQLIKTIRKHAGNTLTSINVFDVFEGDSIGKDKKSIAFRLNFVDPNKTLNISEVEPIINKIVKKLENSFDAKLRS